MEHSHCKEYKFISFVKEIVYKSTLFYFDFKIQKWGMVSLVLDFELQPLSMMLETPCHCL